MPRPFLVSLLYFVTCNSPPVHKKSQPKGLDYKPPQQQIAEMVKKAKEAKLGGKPGAASPKKK
jgi:hypothetical protein